uniref:Uncharacterized protein n=1 Tax=Anopheles atroparvus TaxID=41427 RepID=A0A182J6H4_ANOAO
MEPTETEVLLFNKSTRLRFAFGHGEKWRVQGVGPIFPAFGKDATRNANGIVKTASSGCSVCWVLLGIAMVSLPFVPALIRRFGPVEFWVVSTFHRPVALDQADVHVFRTVQLMRDSPVSHTTACVLRFPTHPSRLTPSYYLRQRQQTQHPDDRKPLPPPSSLLLAAVITPALSGSDSGPAWKSRGTAAAIEVFSMSPQPRGPPPAPPPSTRPLLTPLAVLLYTAQLAGISGSTRAPTGGLAWFGSSYSTLQSTCSGMLKSFGTDRLEEAAAATAAAAAAADSLDERWCS